MGVDMDSEYKLNQVNEGVRLPEMEAQSNEVVVVGYSNGSTMAHQLHVIYSSIIKGAGLISGGPFL